MKRLIVRLLDALTFCLYAVGLAMVGAFFTNTRTVGIRDSALKEPMLVISVGAWPLTGLLDLLSVGGHFFGSLFGPLSPRRAWRLLLVALGGRYLLQQHTANKRPKTLPSGVSLQGKYVESIHEEVAKAEGIRTHGVRGKLFRLNEIYSLEVATYQISLKNLPPEFDGFKIAQVTDIHNGHFISPLFPRKCVQAALQVEPDLVALTGDYQHHREAITGTGRLLRPLGEWSARKGGRRALAVLGNHDTWPGTAAVTHALRKAGIDVLHNRHVEIKRGSASIYVAGVADPWSLRADLDLALHGIPEGAFTLLLCHVPDLFREAAHGVALQLSGHLHGGQIKLPIIGAMLSPSRFNRRYIEGFYRQDNSLMYVCRGLGGHPPVRYGSKPEIAVFVLRSAAGNRS